MSRFLEGVLKEFLKKHTQKGQPLLFKFLDFHFIVEVYTDHTKADKDKSKTLSVKEALTLGLVLSLDGIAAGVGSGLLLMGNVKIFILSFMIGFLAIKAGVRLGEKISRIGNFEVSWLSGVLLMVIAFLRLQIF
jgi:putative sporulation protein YtaF